MKRITAMLLCAVLVMTTMFGTWSGEVVYASDVQESSDNLGTMPDSWVETDVEETVYGPGLTIPNWPTTEAELYSTQKAFEKIPHTFEATFQLPTSLANSSTRGGVLIGNYCDSNNASIQLEIHEKGHPRVYYNYRNESNVEVQFTQIFDQVQVCTGEPIRLTVVCDTDAGKIIAYINGVKQQEKEVTYAPVLPTAVQVIGSDRRLKNYNSQFKGAIYDVTTWADVRTQEEITNSSIKSLDTTDENLIAAYNFNTVYDLGKDLSGNEYNLTRTPQINGVYTSNSIEEGMTFDTTPLYQTVNKLSRNLVTISSWIQLPTTHTGRAGLIFGNYIDSGDSCIDIEIHENGAPRFYYRNSNNATTDWKYTGTDVRAEQWVHLVMTIDEESNSAACYLNGVLQETITKIYSNDISIDSVENGYVLGGDLRKGNGQYFKGRIKEVALYDEILTADQVETLYMCGIDSISEAPFSYYDVTNAAGATKILDTKGTNHLVTDPADAEEPVDERFYDKEEMTDYAYSFAVVGDPQITTEYDKFNNTTYLNGIFDWIVENKESKNIQHVFGLGDISNNNTEGEWQIAQAAISKLDGQVPYTLVRGNHDLVGVKNAEDKTADYYTQYIGSETYKNQFENGGFYAEDNIWNAWRTFTVGETDYLALALDFGASDEVLAWASEIVEAHPMHNVIMITHGYLETDGEPGDEKDTCPPTHHDGNYNPGLNNGNNIWHEFVSQHKNIVLVMSGHIPSEEIVVGQAEGVHGNTVTSMLINPQYIDSDEWNAGRTPTGMVTMLYFSEDGSEIKIERYSTAREKYFLRENEKTVTLDVVSKKKDDHTVKTVSYSAEEAKTIIGAGTGYPKDQEGYVFAGWYAEENCTPESALSTKDITTNVYAKFVPTDVLDVKAQLSENLLDGVTKGETGDIRFVTTVDSASYKKVGFDYKLKSGTRIRQSGTLESDTVYKQLYAIGSDGQTILNYTPEYEFCGASKYFKAITIAQIPQYAFDWNISVKPYWVTLDGTKVYGHEVTKTINQGIDEDANENATIEPMYMAKLSGNYYNAAGASVQWKDIWQNFSGYQEGETYVFSCDYYMPIGSHGSIRFRASSGTVEQGMYGGNAGHMEVKYTIQAADVAEGGYFGPCMVQYPGGEGYYWNLRVTKEGSNENLLRNADFSEGDGSWIGWKFGGAATVTTKEESIAAIESNGASIVAYDEALFGTQYVAKMVGTHNGNSPWKDVWQSFVGYEVGETYVFTVDYYMPEGSAGSIRFRGSSKGTVAEKGLAGGTRGTASVEYTIQEGDEGYFGPCMVQHPGGEGYYWNLRVTKKGTTENLLYNADFSNTDGSWIGWMFGNDFIADKAESDNLLDAFGATIIRYGDIPF